MVYLVFLSMWLWWQGSYHNLCCVAQKWQMDDLLVATVLQIEIVKMDPLSTPKVHMNEMYHSYGWHHLLSTVIEQPIDREILWVNLTLGFSKAIKAMSLWFREFSCRWQCHEVNVVAHVIDLFALNIGNCSALWNLVSCFFFFFC